MMRDHRSSQPDASRQLAREVDAAAVVIEQARAQAGDDEAFLTDIVEGETDIFEIIARVDEAELEDRTLIAGLDVMIKRLQERRDRIERSADVKRALIASALVQIGLTKHKTPLGTLSLSHRPPRALPTDEAEIPARFWKPQPPKLDREALTAALRERQKAIEAANGIDDLEARKSALVAAHHAHPDIPGVTLSNGSVSLSVRR